MQAASSSSSGPTTRSQIAGAEYLFPTLDEYTGKLINPTKRRKQSLARAHYGHGEGKQVPEKDLALYYKALEVKARSEGISLNRLRWDDPEKYRLRPTILAPRSSLYKTGSCLTPMDVFRHPTTFRHVFEEVLTLCRFALRIRLTSSLYPTGRLVLDYHKGSARKFHPDPYHERYSRIDGNFVHGLKTRILSRAGSLSPLHMSPSELIDMQWVVEKPTYLQNMVYLSGLSSHGSIKLFFNAGDVIVLRRPSTDVLPALVTLPSGLQVPNPDRLVVKIEEVIPEPEDPNFGVLSVSIIEESPPTIIQDILESSEDPTSEGQRILYSLSEV